MEIADYVKSYDPQNQFDVLKKSYQQIEYAEGNKYGLEKIQPGKIQNIVVSGLGGSAIAGDVFANLFGRELNIPYFVNRNYMLPQFVNESTLVIISSYSGNTEETISSLNDAIKRKAQIICITTGGEIGKIAEKENLSIVYLQKGFQPRFAFWISIFTLIKIFEILNFIPNQKDFISESKKLLVDSADRFSGKEKNVTLEIAKSLIGYIPVIYSAESYTSGVGLRLKGQFNENSKSHAFHNVIPEMNHNEIIGWETFEESKFPAKVIFIYDDVYHVRIKTRFEIVAKIIKKSNSDILTLKSERDDFRLRVMDLIYTGDWISYYLAILRKHDPSEIDNINYLKEELAKR